MPPRVHPVTKKSSSILLPPTISSPIRTSEGNTIPLDKITWEVALNEVKAMAPHGRTRSTKLMQSRLGPMTKVMEAFIEVAKPSKASMTGKSRKKTTITIIIFTTMLDKSGINRLVIIDVVTNTRPVANRTVEVVHIKKPMVMSTVSPKSQAADHQRLAI